MWREQKRMPGGRREPGMGVGTSGSVLLGREHEAGRAWRWQAPRWARLSFQTEQFKVGPGGTRATGDHKQGAGLGQ